MPTHPSSSRTGHRAVLAFAAVGALSLGACSAAPTEPEASAEEVLAAAKTNLDETSGVHLLLATEQLPKGVAGVLSADGIGAHPPAFEGDLKVVTSGITADVAVVAVDDVVYAKLPFTTDFAEVDPADYGAPDPADLMRTDGGLSSLLSGTEGAERGERTRDGEQVLTEYTGTLPGSVVADVIPSAAARGEFEVTYEITDDELLREAVLTGPFYPDAADVTYTISFDEYDSTPEIAAPATP